LNNNLLPGLSIFRVVEQGIYLYLPAISNWLTGDTSLTHCKNILLMRLFLRSGKACMGYKSAWPDHYV